MSRSTHFRFVSYVLCVTALVAAIVLCWYRDFLPFFFVILPLLQSSMREILGPTFKGWHERDRDVSNRTLVIGFIICLVAVWVGGIIVAHYLSPEQHAPKYLLWIMAAVFWLLLNYHAYQWWYAQKTEGETIAQ